MFYDSKNAEVKHSHDHIEVSGESDRRYLFFGLFLLTAFLIFEFILGLVANSLALLTDSAHMLTDVAAIVLAIVAIFYSKRPANEKYTYGWQRVQILSSQINGVSLLVLGGIFIFEAIRRFINPEVSNGKIVLYTAILGVIINIIVTLIIGKANKSNLNIKGAYLHILTDLYAFLGTIIAGIVIILFDWRYADAIASIFVALIMIISGFSLTKQATDIFLESAPSKGITKDIAESLLNIDHVKQLHDLHVWTIDSMQTALSVHILIDENKNAQHVQEQVKSLLTSKFSIFHSTIQIGIIKKDLESSVCGSESHGEVYTKDYFNVN